MSDVLCSPDEYQYLTHTYTCLLRLPHGVVRGNMQPTLSGLRDEIARVSGRDPQDVQDHFEAMVVRLWGHP